MDDTELIHKRTDQILRDRIKYGMYGGETKKRKTSRSKTRKVVKRKTAKRRVGRPCGGEDYDDMMGHDEDAIRTYDATVGTLGRRSAGSRKQKLDAMAELYGGAKRRKISPSKKKSIILKKRGMTKKRGMVKHRKRTSPWIKFVKEYAKINGINYKTALSEAGPYYHSQ